MKEHLEDQTVLKWPEGTRKKIPRLIVREATEGGVYPDGRRMENQTAASTITRGEILRRYTTVMDAEMLAVAMGWEMGELVITDSQAAIGRITNIQLEGREGGSERV